jgi:hypothetical protein
MNTKMNTNDELLIQRCVDDELSPSETRLLLRRLDELDGGWKQLSCELLEDRSLRKILSASDAPGHDVATPQLQAMPVLSTSVRRSVGPSARSILRHWWSHPVTSLSLCVAIAFVGGMLIPDSGVQRSGSGVASNSGRTNSFSNPVPMAQNADTGSADSYRIQMQPGGQNVEIPVYSGIHDLVRSDRNHPLFSDSIQNADGRVPQMQWMIVPVGENKSMLIPVSEDTLGDMQ